MQIGPPPGPAGMPVAPWSTVPGRPRRLDERGVLRIGLVVTFGFLALSVVSAVLTVLGQSASAGWATLHLALAGASTVAIGTFMPHFGVTLAGAVPESASLRLSGVLALALGAGLAIGAVVVGVPIAAVPGAAIIWAGLAITAWTTFAPGRSPLARRHPVAKSAYLVALAEVAIGVALPALYLAGWEPAVSGWSRLKPAHVWLNLFGFVSLTITATLVYLYPTIVGARIKAGPGLAAMVGGGIAGAPLVALAAMAGWEPVAVIGAAVAVIGGLGQLWYAADVWRRRTRWTTDAAWHVLTIGHLSAGMGWYAVVMGAALVGIIRDGVAPAGWTVGALAVPLVAGWAIQVLVGTATHLLPAMVTTLPAVRARQRVTLAPLAVARLVAWNAGVALAWAGLGSGSTPLVAVGIALLLLALSVSLTVLGRAIATR